MRDLAILVPSRGRPKSVTRLTEACKELCKLDYKLCWAFDDDDPDLAQNTERAQWTADPYVWQGPRKGLAAWTNHMWEELEGEFRMFASIGDDHVPLTPGWDARHAAVLDAHGGGFAYCNNGQAEPNYPEMCVVSAPVLSALGWFAEPSLLHYCIDVVWMDLGKATDSLYYLPDVTLEHRHWAFPGPNSGARDDTYWDAAERGRQDVLAHATWKDERMAADVAKVRQALARIVQEAR
jgi:hypothetical protein